VFTAARSAPVAGECGHRRCPKHTLLVLYGAGRTAGARHGCAGTSKSVTGAPRGCCPKAVNPVLISVYQRSMDADSTHCAAPSMYRRLAAGLLGQRGGECYRRASWLLSQGALRNSRFQRSSTASVSTSGAASRSVATTAAWEAASASAVSTSVSSMSAAGTNQAVGAAAGCWLSQLPVGSTREGGDQSGADC